MVFRRRCGGRRCWFRAEAAEKKVPRRAQRCCAGVFAIAPANAGLHHPPVKLSLASRGEDGDGMGATSLRSPRAFLSLRPLRETNNVAPSHLRLKTIFLHHLACAIPRPCKSLVPASAQAKATPARGFRRSEVHISHAGTAPFTEGERAKVTRFKYRRSVRLHPWLSLAFAPGLP